MQLVFCGIDVANQLNLDAIRAMAPFEVRRLQGVLGIDEVQSFADLEAFVSGAIGLLTGDFLDFRWHWQPPDGLQVQVVDCFAHKGIARLGAVERYRCGIFYRICAWLDVLGIEHTVSPPIELCSMHHDGACVRDFSFTSAQKRFQLADPKTDREAMA